MGKDSFLIYTAFYKPISILSDKQLGRLFRAIFAYNLGEAVSVEDDIRMAFEFFKNQFDIDESKYQAKVMKCAEGGRKGGNPNFKKGQSNPYYSKNKGEKEDKPTLTKITSDNPTLSRINLNDNVNDNVSSGEDIKENTPNGVSKKAADAPFPTPTENLSAEINGGIRDSKATLTPVAPPPSPVEKRERTFRDSLAPFVSKYGEEMIRAFCDYWTERNKSGTKMRFEMEKTWDTARRLVRWDINNNKFKRDYAGNTKPVYGNKAPEEFGKGYWSDDI